MPRLLALNVIFLLLQALLLPCASAQTIQASTSSSNSPANAASRNPAAGGTTRWLAFESDATNLIDGDTNDATDIFLLYQTVIGTDHNPQEEQRTTTRVSVASDGTQANGPSFAPSVSRNYQDAAADARFIAFVSSATNLVAGDSNGKDDIFVHDRVLSQTYRISLVLNPSSHEAVGEANGNSSEPSISSDGCYIAFTSEADNLNAVDTAGQPISDTNGKRDVFLYHNPLGQDCDLDYAFMEMVSVGPNDTLGNGDSGSPAFGDVRYLAFVSQASNLIASDSNSAADVFVRDRAVSITGYENQRATILVSKSSSGSQGDDASLNPAIDSNVVVFDSAATNLVSNDTNGKRDVFRHDLQGDRSNGTTVRVSVSSSGDQGDGDSYSPAIDAGANYIAFASRATNFSDRTDCNDAADIFVLDYFYDVLRRVNLSSAGYQAGAGLDSSNPSIGGGAVLSAYESNGVLVPGDENNTTDIFGSVGSEDPAQRDNPLSRSERLDEPPDVCVARRSASVFMERYTEIDASASTFRANASGQNGACRGNGICYTVTAVPFVNGKRDRRRDIVRKTGKRNELTLPKLKPGSYQVSFKVNAKQGSSVIKTGKSPAQTITVARRK